MKSLSFYLSGLIGIVGLTKSSIAVVVVDEACWPLYAALRGHHGVYGKRDFPIELLYPNEVVYPNKIHRESLAFRQWRHNTPENIPDEAFNAHYMTREQLEQDLARKAGFASAHAKDAILNTKTEELAKLPGACRAILEAAASQTGLFKSIPLSRYLKLPGAQEMLLKAKTHSGTANVFLKKIGVDPKMNLKKVQEASQNSVQGFSHKYFVDSYGQAYLFTASEQKKILESLGVPLSEGVNHPQLASLIFGEMQVERELLGVGYFEVEAPSTQLLIKTDVNLPMMNTKVIDFSAYFKSFLGL